MKIFNLKNIIISIISLITIIALITLFFIFKNNGYHTNKLIQKYSINNSGSLDTSKTFQKMINDLPIGSTIILPEGKYKIINTINLKAGINLIGTKNVIFIGNGKNTLFNASDSNSFKNIRFQNCGTAIYASDKESVYVNNCKFTNKISYAAINFYDTTYCSVKNSCFNNIKKYGILIDADSSYIIIDKNDFYNPRVFGGYNKEQIGGHIYCLNGSKITVTNNNIENSGGQGILFGYNSSTNKGTTDSIAKNNLCIGNGQEGVTIYGGDSKVSKNNSLISNTCKNNRFNQIEVWQADNCIITNNSVEESEDYVGNVGAITLFSTNNTSCINNKIMSAQSNGIVITAGSQKCIVSDNNVMNTNGKADMNTPEKGNGILLDSNGIGDPAYITINNNTISAEITIHNKSGIYSTSNTNHHNKIYENYVYGYEFKVHEYATATCDN